MPQQSWKNKFYKDFPVILLKFTLYFIINIINFIYSIKYSLSFDSKYSLQTMTIKYSLLRPTPRDIL